MTAPPPLLARRQPEQWAITKQLTVTRHANSILKDINLNTELVTKYFNCNTIKWLRTLYSAGRQPKKGVGCRTRQLYPAWRRSALAISCWSGMSAVSQAKEFLRIMKQISASICRLGHFLGRQRAAQQFRWRPLS